MELNKIFNENPILPSHRVLHIKEASPFVLQRGKSKAHANLVAYGWHPELIRLV